MGAASPTASSSERDLHTLLSNAAAGRVGAVDELLAVLHPLVRRYSRARLRPTRDSHQVADAVAQDICIAVLLELRHYARAELSAEAFVYRIATEKVAAVGEPGQPAGDDPARDMLAGLPGPLREVLLLRAAVGLDVTQIARTLNQSPGAVRFNQHRAVRRLRGPDRDGPPLDLAQIRAVDVLLDRLIAGDIPVPAEQDGCESRPPPDAGPPAAGPDAPTAAPHAPEAAPDTPEAQPDRDELWLVALARLRRELDEQPDVTERLHRVLAGRPLWALDPSEHPTPPELEDTAPLDLLVVPALPDRRESRLVRWAEKYVPVVSAAAVAVLVVGGFSALITDDPLRPVDGVADVVVGLTQPDAPAPTAADTLNAAPASAGLEQQVVDAISGANAAVDAGDRQQAELLLTEARTKVRRIQPEKAAPLTRQIAAVQAEVAASPTAGPTTSPTSTPSPSTSPTSPPTSTPPPTSPPTSPATTSPPATTPSTSSAASGGAAGG